MEENPYLQIPSTLTKIATKQITGGWDLTFHVPETHGESVRELVGTENKQNFVMMLVKVGKDEPCIKQKGKLQRKIPPPKARVLQQP